MIKAVILINSMGKIRLINFYEKQIGFVQQQALVRSIYRIISNRSDELCNFIDSFTEWPTADTQIIYRRYATLIFVFVTDSSESQLAILDLIQVFVEVLDRTFENVCELDFIFHSEKVQHALMEIIMGGMVLETYREEIIRGLSDMANLAAAKTATLGGVSRRLISGYK
ncbi:unnamed protein product [Phytomonas sp. Hart1]|nr:unnamed protein product [Phytomonas sp. Hart1]|eukprot:CCW65993.1 unnamed protein product [Phytomonas sp. isolate Hart1]